MLWTLFYLGKVMKGKEPVAGRAVGVRYLKRNQTGLTNLLHNGSYPSLRRSKLVLPGYRLILKPAGD